MFLELVQMFRNQATESRAQGSAGDPISQQGTVALPAIYLPKGSGAIRGIGEDFPTAFSPVGRWLVTAGCENTARLWTLPVDLLIEKACRVAGRNLTLEEWQRFFPGEPHRQTCADPPAHPSARATAERETP